MLVSCPRCGRVHERGRCPLARRPYDGSKRTDEQRFRSTSAWQRLASWTKERDRHLCLACLHQDPPLLTAAGLSSHHIAPLREDWDRRLDPDNVVTLCPLHHELAEAGEIPADRLAAWVAQSTREYDEL